MKAVLCAYSCVVWKAWVFSAQFKVEFALWTSFVIASHVHLFWVSAHLRAPGIMEHREAECFILVILSEAPHLISVLLSHPPFFWSVVLCQFAGEHFLFSFSHP